MTETPSTDIILRWAQGPDDIEAVRALFLDYQADLGIDLCFQGFAAELDELPGVYTTPNGAIALALVGGSPAGCCAFRPLEGSDHLNACEMKRLYVRQAYRGLGLGRQLTEAILDAAHKAGYACVLLDTLDDMESARALYEDLGFEEIPPYYHNPHAGAHYLKVDIG